MNSKIHRYIACALRLYIAFVFISACLHKIANPYAFAVDIATYQFLPLIFINLLAIVLPYVELGSGVMLAIGYKPRAAALMTSGMMVMFMIALTFALVNDLNISCGCFASGAAAASDPISPLTMLRDSIWLLMSLYIVIFDRQPISIKSIFTKIKNFIPLIVPLIIQTIKRSEKLADAITMKGF